MFYDVTESTFEQYSREYLANQYHGFERFEDVDAVLQRIGYLRGESLATDSESGIVARYSRDDIQSVVVFEW